MKIRLSSNVPTNADLIALLSDKLPQYKYNIRVGRFVDVKKSFFVGASVIPKKDGLVVNGNFPSAGASITFTLFMFATGILIGLIVWLATWRNSQNDIRDQVAKVLEGHYKA